ncbi:MAG: CheB methylesterase domain-containing protein [Bacteroidota bacterium]|jgi:two-component system chemotaxis response regulator CheB
MVRVFAIAKTPGWSHRFEQLISQRDDIEIARMQFGDDGLLGQLKTSHADIVAIEGGPDWNHVQQITRSIMEAHPLPVVILVMEPVGGEELQAMGSLDAGALSLLNMPQFVETTEEPVLAEQLSKSIRLMAEVKVVRRWDSARLESLSRPHHGSHASVHINHHLDIVAIGASAGGTKALQEVFSKLTADFPLPILVVQHIAKGYLGGLSRWLEEQTALRIMIAEDGQTLEGGTVYLAPDDAHLTVDQKHRILLIDDEPINGFKPSIARLFRSIQETFGRQAVAILLSGMGNDGAQEMLQLHLAGAFTIAQDKETSLIHGIPGEAIKLDAVNSVLPVHEIGPILLSIAARQARLEDTGDRFIDRMNAAAQEQYVNRNRNISR